MTEETPARDPTSAAAGTSAKAVFLSYATQDVETARGIAESLRAVGIEVWWDQAKLAGGDAWDRKIRQQIQSCALFVPVISANTEARTEGYFRLEWWLAEQRSFRMARDRPFLFPVVTDISRTAQAQVPEMFREVQWTRLEGGQIPADFAARVQALLAGEAVTPVPAGTQAAARSQQALAPDDKSIAVLAFADMSPQKDQEYFSDGIAEELLNLLVQVTQLRVIARTSSFSFKGQSVAIADIARRLNVTHILEGSVRKAGNKVRITAQLIRAADSTHLWSATYDRSLDDIFAVQDEIAAEVVEQLKIRLLGAAPTVVETDPEAYALYLQALQIGRQGTIESWEQAQARYEQALAIDPAYAAAWTGLASVYISQTGKSQRPPAEGYAVAREAANKALIIDPDCATAHAQLGTIADSYDGDLAAAARHFGRALSLDPANPEIRDRAATFAVGLGRLDEAIKLLDYSIARDPVNAISHRSLAGVYYYSGQLDRAIASYRTALTLSPTAMGLCGMMSRALLMNGEHEAAMATIEREQSDWTMLEMPIVYYALGQMDKSDAALAELVAKYEREAAFNIACIQAYRGEPDEAFDWLDKAVAYRDPGLSELVAEPLLSNLHDDPRWQLFLERLGRSPRQLAAITFDVTAPRRDDSPDPTSATDG